MQIVWFSEIKWDYLRTRKQQIIARKPADVQLLYLEPYAKGRRNHFRLRTEGDIFCATVPFIKSVPYFPWRTVLDRRLARSAVDLVARTRIQGLLRNLRFDPERVGFIISNIYAADIVLQFPRRFLLYDCNDAHSSFPGMRAWSEAYFYKTCRIADTVFASSRELLRRVSSVRGGERGCEYLGNGVEFSHFENGWKVPRPPDEAKMPRLGYLGAIAPWLDLDLLYEVATAHADWEIVLVGPVMHSVAKDLEKLTALPNVYRLAAVSYDNVPETLRQFTVGLIPFRRTELTQGVNPNKLYEYWAAGLPVVATAFSEEVKAHPDIVASVDTRNGFIRACEEAVASVSDEQSAESLAERARSVARANDWNVIAETFWDKVKNLMTRRAGEGKGVSL